MANRRTDFDRWFRDQIGAIFGFDPAAPAQPRNELLGEWREASRRGGSGRSSVGAIGSAGERPAAAPTGAAGISRSLLVGDHPSGEPPRQPPGPAYRPRSIRSSARASATSALQPNA